jgi:hypothetical protein
MNFTMRNRNGKSRGFALVVTLMMMVLIVAVAIGLSTLSTVEMRKSSSSQARAVAAANARVALMIAIGELQKHLGPDQRVSADGRVASGPDGVPENANWTSVWSTTLDRGAPVIARNSNDGGLRDDRVTGRWDRERNRLACLVSGNEVELEFAGDSELAEEERITLVGDGTVGDPEAGKADPQVHAPKVLLGGKGGAYAWWVGDLGLQAHVGLPDVKRGMPDRALQLAQDVSYEAFAKEGLSGDERGRLVTEGHLRHTAAGAPAGDAFHEVTTRSAGLLVNVRDGGLRKDLTAYLDGNGQIPDLREGGWPQPGMSDGDNLVGPQRPADAIRTPEGREAVRLSVISPNFGLLRDWARRAQSAPFGDHRGEAEEPVTGGISTGGRNPKPVEILNRTKSFVAPVLAEGSLYYQISYFQPTMPNAANPYGLRLHLYPRVALWNPYQFPMRVEPSAIFFHINGNKLVRVRMNNGTSLDYRMNWGLNSGKSRGAVCGSLFFMMEGVTLQPGQTLVWAPKSNRPYDESAYHNNVLSTETGPDPRRSFHQDRRADANPLFEIYPGLPSGREHNRTPAIPVDWREVVAPKLSSNLQASGYTQADDYLMIWKPMKGAGTLTQSSFNSLPMGRFVSCAYQYGDEDEMPLEWSSADPVPMSRTSESLPVISTSPDRRTREGFRLRWFEEHESNQIGSGSLAGTPHLQSAPIANWNMRASYSLRNPFDNVTDIAPHFFGIYTRDLFDGAVDWSSMQPRAGSSGSVGDPFDQAQRFNPPRVLFDVPRRGAEVLSLAAFQHVNLSEMIWSPTYVVGNSLVDPRIGLTRTEPRRSIGMNRDQGGWNQDTIGYATDGRSNNDNGLTTDEDNWAWHARTLIQDTPLEHTVFYDLSYEVNHSLWDQWFLSTGSAAEKRALLDDPGAPPLPNARMKPTPFRKGEVDPAHLADYHRAAANFVLDGAFNVNSASVGAWEALLLSSLGRHSDGDHVAFPRAPTFDGRWDGEDVGAAEAWNGARKLDRAEVRRLAEEMVREVRVRGPFLSLADFVNRRLREDETGRMGALQAAIDRAGVNAVFAESLPIDNSEDLPDYKHPDQIKDPTRLDQSLVPSTSAWGAPGFLTQADVLQHIGPVLSARSDTFRIRAAGEAHDASGKVLARVVCEAVVQRVAEYVDPTDTALEIPRTLTETNRRFGRRFEVVSFRWLHADEV